MDIELQVRTAVVILAAVLLVVSGGSLVAAELSQPPAPAAEQAELVVLDDGSILWPYTSRGPTFEQRTLSINVVIYGDTSATQTVLRDIPFGDWEELDEEREDVAAAEGDSAQFNETLTNWGAAAGANRFIWVDPAGDFARWKGESYQLEDGDYLGHRHHIRAYEDPNGNWTAIQAHTEHWDWFHLRHTVHTIEETQLLLEEQLIDRWYVRDLHRERFGNDASSDADGWVTIVDLDDELFLGMLWFSIIAATGVGLHRRTDEFATRVRTDPSVMMGLRTLAAMTAIVFAYHFVRFGAIALERHLWMDNPKIIVALFFPALVIGMPVAAYLSARKLDSTTAFAAATVGFIIAVFIDYTYLGVLRIPLDTFVHRAALAVGIGLIAAGASATARDPELRSGHVRTGVLLWLVAVALPLLQFVPIPFLF